MGITIMVVTTGITTVVGTVITTDKHRLSDITGRKENPSGLPFTLY
jgi:hypothetical protein